jgi:translation initiation factor IF-3
LRSACREAGGPAKACRPASRRAIQTRLYPGRQGCNRARAQQLVIHSLLAARQRGTYAVYCHSLQERPIARGPLPAPPTRDGPRVNEEIRVPQVRLIDENGDMQGVLSVRDAQAKAYSVGLDLVEISPNAEPPVCKILDYGKFKYEQQKKKNEAKKKQKIVEIKEVKVRPNIDENDYQVKMRAMKSFIGEGDKVKVTLRFRGREMAHQELGVKVLERIRQELEAETKVEQMPRMEMKQMVMVLSPK